MGNICCQTQIVKSFNQDQILKQDQYKEASLPIGDAKLNQWTQLHNIKLPSSNQNSEVKIVKHNQLDRYYYGSWKEGMPEGQAFFYEPQKLLFNGSFVHGLPTGHAHIQFIREGCQFQGQLKDGKANGTGTLDNLNQKYQYKGQWQNSKPKKGTLTFVNDQNISHIQFQDFHKKTAVIHYKDGRRYEGQINTSKLQPNGKGKVTFPLNSSKAYYDGEWHNGTMNGKGDFQWTDGSHYSGQFIHGKKEGWGTFAFPNGNSYVGYWISGKQEGAGTLLNKNGQQIKKGHWTNGVFNTQLSKQQWQVEKHTSQLKRQKVLEQIKSEIKQEQKHEKQRNEQSNYKNHKQQSAISHKKYQQPKLQRELKSQNQPPNYQQSSLKVPLDGLQQSKQNTLEVSGRQKIQSSAGYPGF